MPQKANTDKRSTNGVRLDSARLGELVAAHDCAVADAAQLSRLRDSYADNLQQARATPRMVDSIEDYDYRQRHSSELLSTASRGTRQADERLAALHEEARSYLQAMLDEGMPENLWIGTGDGEYILIECESPECRRTGCEDLSPAQPVLYRAPARALELAPAWATPAAVEDRAEAMIRSAYGSILDSGCRVVSGAGVACAILGLALILTDGLVGIAPAAGGVAMFAGLMCVLAARTVRELGPPSAEQIAAEHYQEDCGETNSYRENDFEHYPGTHHGPIGQQRVNEG